MTTQAHDDKIVHRIVPTGEFVVSNGADVPELRRRLDERGYLFLRGLVNTDGLMQVRRDILALCREHGWLNADAPLIEGLYSGIPFPDPATEYMALYRQLIQLDSFNALSKSLEIVNLLGLLVGGELLVHARNIARISFPRNYASTTQPHQDFFYIRGTPQPYTAWIPVGDCPRELGGLAVMEGSHRLGFLDHAPAIGAGGNAIRTAGMSLPWLTTDFVMGDIVVFHSHTIHG